VAGRQWQVVPARVAHPPPTTRTRWIIRRPSPVGGHFHRRGRPGRGRVAAAVVLSGGGKSDEDLYVEALDEAGANEWVTESAAVNAGYSVCERFDQGAPPRGSATDLIAVEHLCPDYLESFRELANATVEGSFTVFDPDNFGGMTAGLSCFPGGGFGDINASTQVIVRNSSGDELGRTQLGDCEISDPLKGCRFDFSIDLTEGETIYIVEVGDRGEISYSWEEIREPETLALSLGDI